MTTSFLRVLALTLAGILAACGGGGGIGSGGTGIEVGVAEGSISGFGSVVVDGIAYATNSDQAQVETAPDQFATRTARWGETVRVEYESVAGGGDRAAAVRVDAMAVGTVASVGAPGFVVMGQTVVVVTDPALGTPTFFDGLAGLSALRAGQAVEVHGRPRFDAASGRYQLVASRVSLLASLPSVRRVGGIVQAPLAGGFTLGGVAVTYAAGSVLPAGTTPVEGDRVIVWSAGEPTGGVLAASGVRVVPVGAGAAMPVRLGGTVSRFDANARRFDLAGRSVRYADATVTPNPNSGAVLADGAIVQVDGVVAGDGAIDATRVKLRKRGLPNVFEAELTGAVSDYAGLAAFSVRGTPVDASAAQRRGCGNGSIAGRNVRVEGSVGAGPAGSVIVAAVVQCLP